MLDLKELQLKTAEFIDKFELNNITEANAIDESMIGIKIFDAPLIGIGDVRDEWFETLKRKEAVGPQFMKPLDWLENAKTVVSFFLPFSEAVRRSNYSCDEVPSNSWLYGRVEGQQIVSALSMYIKDLLIEAGNDAVVPSSDERFRSAMALNESREGVWKNLSYTSNWSERHVAFVCGLGTFGLSKGIITEKGMAGRFGSIVTSAEFPVTERAYIEIYEYCSKCGACVRRCPADAITLENGKDHTKCGPFVGETKVKYAPRYGCGKCQVHVPCESKIPVKR